MNNVSCLMHQDGRNILANLGFWSQSRHKDSCSVVLLNKTDGGVDGVMNEDSMAYSAQTRSIIPY